MGIAAQPPTRTNQIAWSLRMFQIVVVLVIFFGNLLPISLGALLTPLIGPVEPHPGDVVGLPWQRWGFFEAEFAALHIILSASLLLVLVWNPRKQSLLVQFIAIGLVVSALSNVLDLLEPGDPHPFGAGIAAVALFALVAAYPERRRLFQFPDFPEPSKPLLALTIAAALGLSLHVAWTIRTDAAGAASGNPDLPGWLHDAIALVAVLVIGGIFAASKSPGWRPIAIAVAAAFIYLGIASVTLAAQQGAWGTLGGIAAIGLGCLYLGAIVWESRRHMEASVEPAAERVFSR